MAALVVVVHHLILALAPNAHRWALPGTGDSLQNPLSVFWNGPFAVSVFFVLSGFVVTEAALRSPDPLWIRMVVRYLRLAVPAAASTMLAWALLSAFPDAASQLQARNGSVWLGYVYQGSIPGAGTALLDGAIHVFLSGGSAFNNALWTLRPELVGSLLCFAACLWPQAAPRLAIATGAGLVCLATGRSEYLGFALGIGLREAWATGRLPTLPPLRTLLAGLALGSQAGALSRTAPAELQPLIGAQVAGLLGPIGAALVITAVLVSPTLRRVLSSPPGRWLGAISFPLYLIHVPVIDTIVASLAVAAPNAWALTLGLAVTLGAMLAAAHAGERWLERPFLRQLKRLRQEVRARGSWRAGHPHGVSSLGG